MKMDEYVNKEDVIKMLTTENCDKYCHAQMCKFCEYMIDDIEAMKVADVQPVVHAYWIELPKALNPNENPCKCSNCGHILSFMNYYPKSKYCDDCGARMDSKDGDAE